MKKIIILIFALFSILLLNIKPVHALDLKGFDEEDYVRGVADVLQYTPINTSTDYYQGNGPFDTYSSHVLYYDINHVGPVYFFFGNDISDNYNFSNVFEMGFFNFNGLGSNIANSSLEDFKYNNALDNYKAPYIVQNDITKLDSSFYGMALLSPVDLMDVGFYIIIDAQIGSVSIAEDYSTNEILPYIYRADSIGSLHPQYEQNIYIKGNTDNESEAYNQAKREYGYYNGSNWITATVYGLQRYNAGLNENRALYGIFYDGNWLTAEQWGDIQFGDGYDKGLSNEIDWFTWSITFFLMPFRIMNIEVLPGVKIGYFALFSLLLGVVGWFFFIVGKGGGKRK